MSHRYASCCCVLERERVDLRLFGTFPPSRRASDRPIAIACLRLVTFFPDLPERSCPRFISCVARATLLLALRPYFFLPLERFLPLELFRPLELLLAKMSTSMHSRLLRGVQPESNARASFVSNDGMLRESSSEPAGRRPQIGRIKCRKYSISYRAPDWRLTHSSGRGGAVEPSERL